MLDTLLSFIAPHICCGCGKVGSLLCDNCKYDIINEPMESCISCRKPTGGQGVCRSCRLPYQRAWCVGERSDSLERLIDQYKFTNARAAYCPLAEMLDMTIAHLPTTTVVVPIPTIGTHIRQRGYDHSLLIAREFAIRRQLTVDYLLIRSGSDVQRGAGRRRRITQAQRAFHCSKALDAEVTYLVVDDVVTTGATLKYAALALRRAGAKSIVVAAIARQPLD